MTDAKYTPKDHYVYAHYKATTGEIFYIGKGSGCKRFKSSRQRSAWWKSVVAKHGFRVEIIQDGLQEWAALELECALIALHGRADLGLGPLVNLTDGGEGTSNPSEATRAKLRLRTKRMNANAEFVERRRNALIRRTNTPEFKQQLTGWLHTPQVKERTREARAKALQAPSYKIKHAAQQHLRTDAARLRCIKPVRCLETGKVYESCVAAAAAINRSAAAISACLKGRNKTAGGFRWEYVSY